MITVMEEGATVVVEEGAMIVAVAAPLDVLLVPVGVALMASIHPMLNPT